MYVTLHRKEQKRNQEINQLNLLLVVHFHTLLLNVHKWYFFYLFQIYINNNFVLPKMFDTLEKFENLI